MYTNTTGSSANYYYYTYPQPSVCPGCGRCHVCGRLTPENPQIPEWTFTSNTPIVNGTQWTENGDDITLTAGGDANERDE